MFSIMQKNLDLNTYDMWERKGTSERGQKVQRYA